ncbi:MAG: thiamine biosynthesis protein [Candidatus Krumholzibacteria bacterium]
MARKRPKGIGLLSGGLDSALASLVVRDAGADVECLHFFTGFCVTGHNSRVGRQNRPIANHALKVAAEMGIPVELLDIAEDYLPVVLAPKFGYGKNMNPCVDCRIFMLARARDYMEKVGADFVFTGEVLGQRPKSQMKRALQVVADEVGLEGRLLRPLSAKLLPPTRVEQAGLVHRDKLYDISGRSRKRQLALARHYGLKTFMQPAGGCCFLTDKAYSEKLRDIIEYDGADSLRAEDIFVLGVGRHFRLSPRTKVVVGRDEIENNFLWHYKHDHWSVSVSGFAGPTAIVMGELPEADLPVIAAVVARYSDGKQEPVVEVNFRRGEEMRTVLASPAVDEVVEKHRV